jgi:membrane-bound lytic murein transglycosylase D
LETNSLVEERFDPQKSTWAAVRYLKDLYEIYKDWNLVLAAYNCGPGNVNKAIRRAGGSTDYWELYPFLPKETRGYVPGFIAVNYVMTYYCEHGICPMDSQLPAVSDTVHIHKDLHLKQVAGVCNIDIEQLRSLNPQYKKDLIPGNSRVYALRLPNNMATTFIEREDSIYAYDAKKYLTKRTTVAVSDGSSNTKGAKYHKIKSGETLGGIAARYGVSVKQLRSLNGIKGNNIRAGRSIRVR